MVKKFIDPLISLVVIGAVVCVVLFLIAGQHDALNKQIKASVSRFEAVKKSDTDFAKQAINRARDQVKVVVTEGCLEVAEAELEIKWNEECQKLGLKDRCDLPIDIAGELIDQYEQAQAECE